MSSAWILTIVSIVVAACAVLAMLGFRGRVSTVGVDLGTTFSVVGINMHGKIVIVEDKKGNRIFPSIVAFDKKGVVTAVAHDALPYLSTSPENTIFNAKRFMGGDLEDPTTQAYAEAHPYKVVSAQLSNYSKVGFELQGSDENATVVSPEFVGTQVLRHLMKITAEYLGHNQVNKAVIAVPAKFSPEQRAATGEAYKAAGLKVVRVLEEPTAAAVAYKLHKKSNIHHILVYDFGGGTLDVSILYVSKGSVQVYATDGDETLGGSDLDLCLYNVIKNRIEGITGDSLIAQDSNSATSNGAEQSAEACTPAAVRTKAEQVKKELSSEVSTKFTCKMPSSGKLISFDVSRNSFETGCGELFERGMVPVIRLLSDLHMTKDDIDEVVLVGGTTRIPFVKRKLREFFQKALNDHIDPDVTVAYGAASVLD